MVRPTITSTKHIVQVSQADVMFGDRLLVNIAVAKQNPDLGDSIDVEVGATVKAVYVEMWIIGQGQATATQNSIVVKGTNDLAISAIQQSDLHDYSNKKGIFYTTQGLVGDVNSNPVPVIRQWIAIPKGKQRMALGDSIFLSMLAITADMTVCGQITYKSYT